jgi:hypothetical protein
MGILMKKLLMILAIMALATAANAQLVITGVFDGPLPGGVPKFVELYACSDIADLSAYGLGCANNGGGTDGVEYTFPADAVSAGTFIYCESISSTTPTAFFDYFGFNATYDVGFAAGTNGDDAIELFDVSGAEPVVVDVMGDINVDGTGTDWDYLDGWAKRLTATGPDGSTFVIENWLFSGADATDGCLTNDTCASVFPLGNYECDPAVATEDATWGSLKSLYR